MPPSNIKINKNTKRILIKKRNKTKKKSSIKPKSSDDKSKKSSTKLNETKKIIIKIKVKRTKKIQNKDLNTSPQDMIERRKKRMVNSVENVNVVGPPIQEPNKKLFNEM